MNLRGLKISNVLVMFGVITLMIASKVEWYIGILIIIYLLEIKLNE